MAERHDMDTKLQAAIAYLMTGNSEEAGKLVAVPGRTIRYWMQQAWWEDVLREAQTVKQKELDAIWTGLVHKAADKLRERLDEGDAVLTKTGEIKNLPIKAKDLAFIMSVVTDKRAVLRGQATSRREVVSVEQRLEKLNNGFKKIENESTTTEDTDSVH
jgi:hypothetical protein